MSGFGGSQRGISFGAVLLTAPARYVYFYALPLVLEVEKALPHFLAQEPCRQLVVALIPGPSCDSNAPIYRTLFPSVEYLDC
jgi:hypothetical protein